MLTDPKGFALSCASSPIVPPSLQPNMRHHASRLYHRTLGPFLVQAAGISKPSEASDVLARKFDVGQSVYLRPNLSTRNAAFGVYEIRATLPAEDGEFRYRIKSQIELHERVVKESELSKA